MYFQIENIVIWPAREDANPPKRVISFKPGTVNVITGDSRTGKSAVIPIIDYCLGARRCAIPIDVIRDAASWYAVTIITKAGEHILVARKTPRSKGGASDEMAIIVSKDPFEPPDKPPQTNKTLQGVKDYFNGLFEIPHIEHDETVWGNKRLSFRDLAHMAFQSQDIIANQNVLFYKMHETEYRMRLATWFRFIVGAETQETLLKNQEAKELADELRGLNKEIETTTAAVERRRGELAGLCMVAKELGLCDADVTKMTFAELLRVADEITRRENDATIEQTVDDVLGVNNEIRDMQIRSFDLAADIKVIQSRLKELEDMQKAAVLAGNLQSKRRDRLEISKWLQENTKPGGRCPLCGGVEHTAAQAELDKMLAALRRYEEMADIKPPTLVACQKLEKDLRDTLEELIAEQNVLVDSFEKIQRENEAAKEGRDYIRRVYALISELRMTVMLACELNSSSSLMQRKAEVESRLAEINAWLKENDASERFRAILSHVGELAKARLQTLDVEPQYKSSPIDFDERYINVKLKGDDGLYHTLSEIGSASNWVSCHIAYMCALQEYFHSRGEGQTSYMPSFAVFDQPSQVYFPQMKITGDYTETDSEAVKKMFKTIVSSVAGCGGGWQAIILEHAGSDIWGDIEGIHLVEEWRNGGKLIPENWYAEGNKA